MSYYEDELAPPSGDLADTIIRAAGLSAFLLTSCSDPKPDPVSANFQVENALAPEPGQQQARTAPLPTNLATSKPAVVIDPNLNRSGLSYAINVLEADTRGSLRVEQHSSVSTERQAAPITIVEDQSRSSADNIEKELEFLPSVQRNVVVVLAGDVPIIDFPMLDGNSSEYEMGEINRFPLSDLVSIFSDDHAAMQTTSGVDINNVAGQSEFVEEDIEKEDSIVISEPATGSSTAEVIIEDSSSAQMRSVATESVVTVANSLVDELDSEDVVVDSLSEDANNATQIESVAKSQEELSVAPVEVEHDDEYENQSVEASFETESPALSNRAVIQALAAAIASSDDDQSIKHIVIHGKSAENASLREQRPSDPIVIMPFDPEPTPVTESDTVYDSHLDTSEAPIQLIDPLLPAPKNLTTTTFVAQVDATRATTALTLDVAAFGHNPIAAYYIAESVGSRLPRIPSHNDPGWNLIVPTNAYAASETYILKNSYSDKTHVNVDVWFKDVAGKISSPVRGKVTIDRADIFVSQEQPYYADVATGFSGWSYQRGASESGVAPLGRVKNSADADTYLISPKLKIDDVNSDTEIYLQLRQWYRFDGNSQLSDGARVLVEVAVEEAPGQWGDWAMLIDSEQALSTEWTAPKLVLTSYAGRTVKFKIGVTGNLRRLADWGLSDISVQYEQPILIASGAPYTQGFEDDWNRWSSRLPQWSVIGPGLRAKSIAANGLYFASAETNGNESAEFALESPVFQLPNGVIDVRYSEWHLLNGGSGKLQISYYDRVTGWRDWSDLNDPVAGSVDGWQTKNVDLTAYAGLRVRLRLVASLTPTDTAWRIDEFVLSSQ